MCSHNPSTPTHQRRYCPGVQRQSARCIGFGCAIADHADDGLDRVAGAVYLVEVRKGDGAEFVVGIDGPGVLCEGVVQHGAASYSG